MAMINQNYQAEKLLKRLQANSIKKSCQIQEIPKEPFHFGFCTVWLSFLLMLLHKLTFLEVRISTKSLNERMDLEELMTYGCRPTSLALVTKWLFLENQQSLPPSLGLPSGRRYPRQSAIPQGVDDLFIQDGMALLHRLGASTGQKYSSTSTST